MLVGAGGAATAVKGEMSEDGIGTEERPRGEGGGGSEAERGEARRNPYLGRVDPNGDEVIKYTAETGAAATGPADAALSEDRDGRLVGLDGVEIALKPQGRTPRTV